MKLQDRTKFKKLISILRNKARETILNRLNNSDGNFNDLLDSIIEACSKFKIILMIKNNFIKKSK